MDNSPIFIHSLFRSGSTFLFSVFRRTGHYWCYQEPENEWLLELDSNPDALLALTSNNGGNIHHPDIGKPYFWEFHEVRDELKGLFKAEFCFEEIFLPSLSVQQRTYYQALINASRARTVFQFCRSFGQPLAFKEQFGGIHVHLWREPRSQWWSFKINDYFDAATQLIYGAAQLPPALQAVKASCGIALSTNGDLGHDRVLAERSPLKWRDNYKAFFALWLHAQLTLGNCGDIDLSIDHLTHDDSYRNAKLEEFAKLGIADLDLSDCRSPLIRLSDVEATDFREIEQQVADIFIANGQPAPRIEEALERINSLQALEKSPSTSAAANIRSVALRLLDRNAEAARETLSLQDTLQRLSTHIGSQDHAIKLLKEHEDASRKQIADQDHAIKLLKEHEEATRKLVADQDDAIKRLTAHSDTSRQQIADQDRAIKLLTEHGETSRQIIAEYDDAVSRLRSYVEDLESALNKVQDHARNLDTARLDALARVELLETELARFRTAEPDN
ncbi:hypothetical protein [Pseudomonas sp. GCEP-101]|uniref:hypothetical protein n=1 Tax=Pseudomonas sp. GCEP-101 TaxID=2974552 RepID=UPI00223C39ED|nr:hypothetical protein [Pseudomonas sp. GCEP-101]